MKNIFRIALLIALLAVAGCSGTKPELLPSIRKVAILSVSANAAIYNVKSSSVNLTPLASLAGADAAYANYTMAKFIETFRGFGWEVMTADEMYSNSAFLDFNNAMRVMLPRRYNTFRFMICPDNMVYVPFDYNYANLKELIKNTAAGLGVDAVAVIHLDLAYKPVGIAGVLVNSGEAKAQTSIGVFLITPSGEYVIQEYDAPGRSKFGSTLTTPIVVGNIDPFSDLSKAAFNESIDTAVAAWVLNYKKYF